ncbi:hypothetical protein RSAG8_05538, partial [Rhizoctonia solani AG-8 WAC10335]
MYLSYRHARRSRSSRPVSCTLRVPVQSNPELPGCLPWMLSKIHTQRRHLDAMLWLKTTFVGYCHVTHGCKRASVPLYGSNGITRASDGSILVGSYRVGQITVHKPKEDKTLEYVRTIRTDFPLDNLALSADGSIIAAAFPKLHLLADSMRGVGLTAPSAVLRISDATLEGKYNVEKIYEDDGQLGSFATTAAMYGNMLYIHGLMAHRMLACKIPLSS